LVVGSPHPGGSHSTEGSSTVTFRQKLQQAIAAHESILCVGLDPELERLPSGLPRTPDGVLQFNREIIAATSDVVCAYKPNVAFYEALGPGGWDVLLQTVRSIPAGVPVIGDAKRGDIGNTARAYATALFDRLGFDAATVSPYLGGDALEPFLAYADRGVLVLCRTSNAGAAELQGLPVLVDGESRPLYEVVVQRARTWNVNGNVGLVVGATAPAELDRVRALAPELPILVPAIGTQGGDLAAAARAHRPTAPAIVSASRAVIYASSGADFAAAARAAAINLRDALRAQLGAVVR
jgi:orotidine-5'-phosphate decarboxylase